MSRPWSRPRSATRSSGWPRRSSSTSPPRACATASTASARWRPLCSGLRGQPLSGAADAEPAGVVGRELEAERTLAQVVLVVVEQVHERALLLQFEPHAGIAPREVVDRHHGGALPVAPLGENRGVAGLEQRGLAPTELGT